MCFDIGLDWKKEGTLDSILPIPAEDCHASKCLRAWNSIVALLAPQNEYTHITPFLPSQVRRAIRLKAPTLTFGEVRTKQFSEYKLNFLECGAVFNSLKEAEIAWDNKIKEIVKNTRERLFNKTTSRIKWPKGKTVPGSALNMREKENESIYGGILPSSLGKQRQIYQLLISQLVPRMNPFRSRIEATLGIQVRWEEIDRMNIFVDSKYQSFIWRSTHGLLYTNKEYKRFDVKEESKCPCGEEQTLEHIMLQCRRSQHLFANFEKQYCLSEKLSDCEKLMGIGPNKERSISIYKKLNILRKAIIQSNYRDEILRWNTVLYKIDEEYVKEYAIAHKNDRMLQHFKAWDM